MKRNNYMVCLVFMTFFVISFITNILGALIPDIQRSFRLSYSMVAFLPFSFFIAYGVMSIPAGVFVERSGEKRSMLVSFGVAVAGALLLCLFAGYGVSLASLFLMGIGMAMLQVVINPLLRIAGGEEHFAFNSVLAQLLFGLASFISPRIFAYIAINWEANARTGSWFMVLLRKVTNPLYTWTSLYWIFLLVLLCMVLIVAVSRFPRVDLNENERSGSAATYLGLFRTPLVRLYFLGIFCYVGTEQGISDWMAEMLHRYHGLDTVKEGSNALSWYWGLMTAGCAVNLLLLKLYDSRKLLIFFAGLSIVVLGVALWAPVEYALIAWPAMGFTISILFSVIFSLALNSVPSSHGSFSGILCTGIAGGAAVPLLIGWVGDHAGLKTGMCLVFVCLAYILSVGFWARPLIANKTIQFTS